MDAAGCGQLRDETTDGTIGGVLRDPLARLYVEVLEQTQRAERHRHELRGSSVGDTVGHRDERGGGSHEVFGPHAEGASGDDPLPGLQRGDTLTHGIHDAERLGPGARRKLGLVAVRAPDRPQVVIVDGAEHGAYTHLARPGLWGLDLRDVEDGGGIAKGVVNEGTHVSLLSGDAG